MASENGPVESKTNVAGFAALVTSFVMGGVFFIWPEIPETLSTPVSLFVMASVTGAVTWIFSWLTKHTHRNDPAAMQSTKGAR